MEFASGKKQSIVDLQLVQVFHPVTNVSLPHRMLHNAAAKIATLIASSEDLPPRASAAPI